MRNVCHYHNGNSAVYYRLPEGHSIGETEHKTRNSHKRQGKQMYQTRERGRHTRSQICDYIRKNRAKKRSSKSDKQRIDEVFKSSLMYQIVELCGGKRHIARIGDYKRLYRK